MPLTRTELAHYVWEHPEACEARGLTINQAFFTCCCRYRRLRLGEYGTVPLASIRFWPATQCYYVQVIALTAGVLTTALYQRAKRYAAGLQAIIAHTLQAQGITAQIVPSIVLICEHVAHPRGSDDLAFTLTLDHSCQVFSYRTGLEGIHFQLVGKKWNLIGPNGPGRKLAMLPNDLLAERELALYLQRTPRNQWLANATTQPGELANELVITTEGIITRSALEGKGEAQ
jgi:hypothetical protein